MEYEVGQKLDNQYVILEKHHGGMSTVYIVSDEFSNKRFAVKTVREDLTADAQAVGRFAEEARTWMKLGRHPHIVEAIIYREVNGQPFLFLEYVNGGDIQRLLDKEKRLFPPQLLKFGVEVASGMHYVHTVQVSPAQKGVIHRDLKPGNMMLTRGCEVKITDFGLAKVYGARTEAVESGRGLGTYLYMPPEQFLDAASADERSDIYAFGVFLYFGSTGEPPVTGRNASQLVHAILNTTPTAPRELRPELPESFSRLVMHCLSRQRTARPGSFEEIEKELKKIQDEFAAAEAWKIPVHVCDTCGYLSEFDYPNCPVCAAAMREQIWGVADREAPAAAAAQAEAQAATVEATAEALYQQALADEQAGRIEAALNSLRRAAALRRDDQAILSKLDELAQKYRAQRAKEQGKTYNWPMPQGNPARTSVTPESVAPPLALRWSLNISEWAMASPVVSNGALYVAASSSQPGTRGSLAALELTKGHERWRRSFQREVTLSPSVLSSEGLLFLPVDRELICLDVRIGVPRWVYLAETRITSSPLVWREQVYFGDESGKVYALALKEGALEWVTEVQGSIFTPLAMRKERLFVGTAANRVIALSCVDGSSFWEYVAGGEITAGPSLLGNLALFGASDGRLYCLLQHAGRMLWDFETQGEIHSAPAAAEEAAVFGSRDGSIYCVELRTGSLRWEHRTNDWVDSSPAVSQNFAYCTGHDGVLRVLEVASGLSLWEYEVGEEIRSSPAISGGHIVLVTGKSQVLAFRGR
ncbi:MAG: PQQ-binding-like beta-propeller repeat protein [candidate division WS1 bacterium]|jgi:outer membrane protein assembly factor BamB/tRNA A-37 threonylcarbamoyl transferase component Bud32|nr:PQQ-binding-like beta-propeller repeat protein [candidate division WS1 bacterium]